MASYTGAESIPAIPSGTGVSTGSLRLCAGILSLPPIPVGTGYSTGSIRFAQGTPSIPSGGAGTITTYYYRTPAYVRGSTTTPGSWPVGSVVERVVTS